MNLFKPISISLSPNTEKDDIWLAFKLIFQPWLWKTVGGETSEVKPPTIRPIIELEEKFKKYLNVKNAISFNSGRSALMAILDSLRLEKDSEVLLQAFTCNAVSNPILWSRLKPVYVDCDEKTFNIDVEDLKKKITPKSKVIIIQHTFGLPADMDEILGICNQNNLILIEDCAHSLGATYHDKKIGTFGKAAFFSFSRDKVISSVFGGMVVTNDDELARKLREYQKKIGYPSYFWIFQQLLHPILMNWFILPTYRICGKYFLILFQWLQILSKAVHWKEKRGRKPGYFPKRLPNALAILALNQFKKLEKFNLHRKKIAKFYREELKDTSFELPLDYNPPVTSFCFGVAVEQIYLRFTIKHPQAHEIIKKAWRKNLLIGDWYTTPIAPHDTKLEKMNYIPGTCPKAEKLAKITFNLPTHINISKTDAQKIVNFLK
jgi:dTDP-4-amino-4,6-dideoxygalactose transaminase